MGSNQVGEKGRPYALAEAAVLAGNADGVGWLLLDELELVWLDFDHCRDPETGVVDQWAQTILDRAPGAYCEVTPSGAGVRLCGRADGLDVPMQGVWRPPGGEAEGVRPRAQVEVFYACTRFVTVTARTLGGSLEACLGALAFELRQAGLAQAPLGNKSGAHRVASVPGDKLAPIEDVVSALEAIPNDESVGWDTWSKVGMAVWNATEGSEEGFAAWEAWSAKCEDKHNVKDRCEDRWEHWRSSPADDLGIGSLVLRAQAASPGWRRPSRQPAAEFKPEDSGNGEEAAPVDASEGSPFARLARGLIYIEELHRFLDVEDKALLDDQRVKARAAAMGCEGAYAPGPKGIIAQLHSHPAGLLRRVKKVTMRPGQGLLVMEDGGMCANLYQPSLLAPSDADASPWLRHVEALIPVEAEREAVLDRMAFLLQRPGVKINSALLLVGGQGDGKDTALEPLMKAIGSHNVAVESGTAMDGKFNAYMKQQLLLISEVPPWHRKSFYEELKQWLTVPPHTVTVNPKYERVYQIPNIVNVIATSNHEDAMALPDADRRFFVVRTTGVGGPVRSKEKATYYVALYRWFKEGGFEAAAGWLLRRDVNGFNPAEQPMATEAMEEMVRQAVPAAEAWAGDLWGEGGPLERRQLLTVREALNYAGQVANDPDRRGRYQKATEKALKKSGWKVITTRVLDGNNRPQVWVRAGAFELLEALPPKALLARLAADRGNNTGPSTGKAVDEDWGASD